MKLLKIRFLLLIACLTTSCTQELDMPFPQGKEQLVLNSILHPDSTIKISLTKTLPVGTTGSDFPVVDNAEIYLYEDNILIGKPTFKDSIYVLEYLPRVGKEYSIEVEVPGFATLKASDVVPNKADVSICFNEDTLGLYDFSTFDILNVNIVDKADEKNAYWIDGLSTIPEHPCRFKRDSSFWNGNGFSTIEFDTIVCPGGEEPTFLYIKTSNFITYSEVPDRFNAGIDNLWDGVSSFSYYMRIEDSQHDGGLISFDMGIGNYDDYLTKYQEIHDSLTQQIIIMIASQHFDHYLKSSITHLLSRDNYADEDFEIMPFAEIVQTYSNVENGTGIFAAYNSTTFEVGDHPCAGQ
jgi:hypothetical protein